MNVCEIKHLVEGEKEKNTEKEIEVSVFAKLNREWHFISPKRNRHLQRRNIFLFYILLIGNILNVITLFDFCWMSSYSKFSKYLFSDDRRYIDRRSILYFRKDFKMNNVFNAMLHSINKWENYFDLMNSTLTKKKNNNKKQNTSPPKKTKKTCHCECIKKTH